MLLVAQYISASTGNIQIQPLADHPEPVAGGLPPAGPPPSASADGVANPYRIGTGVGTRKPAYGASGIASFTSSSSTIPPGQPAVPPTGFQPAAPVQPSVPFQASSGQYIVSVLAMCGLADKGERRGGHNKSNSTPVSGALGGYVPVTSTRAVLQVETQSLRL